MPHIGDFPAADAERFLLNPSDAVSPITGNTEQGGAAYDPGTGEATYGVYHNSAMRCFRTTAGARTLATTNGSVTEVGVIVNRAFTLDQSRSCALTVIDGTLYASVCGATTGTTAGAWIYKDTSGTSGAGPWTLHATIAEVSTASITNATLYADRRRASEILVMPSGRWVTALCYYQTTSNFLRTDYAVYYSDDDGVNWSPGHYTEQGGVGWSTGTKNGAPNVRAVLLGASSRSFGIVNGKVYSACATNTGQESHWYSSDGASWTRYEIGVGGNHVHTHPFSVGSNGWRGTSAEVWGWTTGSPESSPSFSDDTDLTTHGLSSASNSTRAAASNIGPASLPFIVAIENGKVVGFGATAGGWLIGSIHI